MLAKCKRIIKKILPRYIMDRLDARKAMSLKQLGVVGRIKLINNYVRIHRNIRCPHHQNHIIQIADKLLSIPATTEGVVVEAGCYCGGSTAKLSLICKYIERKLVVFDSFMGIPDNREDNGINMRSGNKYTFKRGSYAASKESVIGNVEKYGEPGLCEFVEGWFEDTMQYFKKPIVLAFIDVDLASSTATCIKHLYPLLQPGGIIFSHDGHRSLVYNLLSDDEYWNVEVGCDRPNIDGLGRSKLIAIHKPEVLQKDEV